MTEGRRRRQGMRSEPERVMHIVVDTDDVRQVRAVEDAKPSELCYRDRESGSLHAVRRGTGAHIVFSEAPSFEEVGPVD